MMDIDLANYNQVIVGLKIAGVLGFGALVLKTVLHFGGIFGNVDQRRPSWLTSLGWPAMIIFGAFLSPDGLRHRKKFFICATLCAAVAVLATLLDPDFVRRGFGAR